jgi:hypothetical protein
MDRKGHSFNERLTSVTLNAGFKAASHLLAALELRTPTRTHTPTAEETP